MRFTRFEDLIIMNVLDHSPRMSSTEVWVRFSCHECVWGFRISMWAAFQKKFVKCRSFFFLFLFSFLCSLLAIVEPPLALWPSLIGIPRRYNHGRRRQTGPFDKTGNPPRHKAFLIGGFPETFHARITPTTGRLMHDIDASRDKMH